MGGGATAANFSAHAAVHHPGKSTAHILGTLPPTVLTRVETHRVIAVIEKAIERLKLLSLLDEQGVEASAARQMQVDENRGVGHILLEQKKHEQRYAALIEMTHKKKHNPKDPLLDPTCYAHVRNKEEEEHLAELAAVSQKLKEQSKLLCRQLKDNPNDADNWAKIVKERADLVLTLKALVVELQTTSVMAAGTADGDGSYENFATKVKEEETTSQWAAALVKKEQETNNNVKAMQNQLKEEHQKKEEMLEKCNRKISELKSELRHLKQHVRDRRDKLKAENDAVAEAQARKTAENLRMKEEVLATEHAVIRSEDLVRDDVVRHAQARLDALEGLGKFWSHKKSTALDEIAVKKHKADVERQTVEAMLQAEEVALEDQKETKSVRDCSKAKEFDAKSEREMRIERLYKAQTKIQACIKGFLVRQLLVTLKKKGAKKSKKKKK